MKNQHPNACAGPGICSACDRTLADRADRDSEFLPLDPPRFPVHGSSSCPEIGSLSVVTIDPRPERWTCSACIAAQQPMAVAS